MNIIFEEKEKVKTIDLETLRATASLAEHSGRLPASKPVEHHQFIDMVGDRLRGSNHLYRLDPIYVSKNESKRIMLLDTEKVGTPQSYLFERLITRLQITDPALSTDHYNSAIAIGYTEKGLQVAFGTNVHICSNMSIFGSRYMSTYGPSKLPFEKMIDLIEKYIQELPKIAEHDFQLFEKMNNIQLTDANIMNVLGKMQVNAVQNTYFAGQNNGLNISQTTAFTKGLIADHADVLHDASLSLFDFYNIGTQILHPDRAYDTSSVWEDTAAWGNFVVNEFDVHLN